MSSVVNGALCGFWFVEVYQSIYPLDVFQTLTFIHKDEKRQTSTNRLADELLCVSVAS